LQFFSLLFLFLIFFFFGTKKNIYKINIVSYLIYNIYNINSSYIIIILFNLFFIIISFYPSFSDWFKIKIYFFNKLVINILNIILIQYIFNLNFILHKLIKNSFSGLIKKSNNWFNINISNNFNGYINNNKKKII